MGRFGRYGVKTQPETLDMKELAIVVQTLTPCCLANDVDVLPHARQRLAKLFAVQILDDELAAGAEPEEEAPLRHAVQIQGRHRKVRR